MFDFWHAGPRVKIALIHRVTLVGRIRLPGHPEPMDELTHVLDWWQQDPEQFLDFIHYFLQEIDVAENDVKALDRTLERGGSVWRATDRGLERRVDPAATAAFEMAASPEDTASDELAVAWTKAYGRDPDLSDAWDHAIKAVEAVLIPIVVPTQAGAHIGHVIGQLDRQGEQWNTLLRFNQTTPPVNPPTTSVQALVGMLRLIYPNPDRHLGPDHRVPTIEEARAVVHLAVTIVQWGTGRPDREESGGRRIDQRPQRAGRHIEARTVTAMAGRPTIAWRREHPYERLVMAYTDAYTNLGIAYSERPPFGATTDSEDVRQFLEKLTQANLSLRLLRVLCHEHVRPTIDAAIKEVDQAVRAPITKTFYRDPSAWLIASIERVEEAARRDVELILRG